ncbi:hypothetical protein EMIT0P4_80095 [Pseudomonas sp. IT-P4]
MKHLKLILHPPLALSEVSYMTNQQKRS